ncbi:Centrosomal spindle body, CEP44-domain-containing protein [Chytridium lagenaria]|nr:Centrosomal spindle body, CEP44-domain-containing protein [Chytridium lagenaria]
MDLVRLSRGDPTSFLPLIHFVLLDASPALAVYISERGHDLYGKRDTRFIEAVYKLLRDEFSFRPTLNKDQFFSMGFAERKLIFISDLIRICKTFCAKNNLSFPGARYASQGNQNAIPPNTGTYIPQSSENKENICFHFSMRTRRALSVSPHPRPPQSAFSRSYNSPMHQYTGPDRLDGHSGRNIVGSSPISRPPGPSLSLDPSTRVPRQTNIIHTTIGGLPVKLTTHVPPPPPSDEETSPHVQERFQPFRNIHDPANITQNSGPSAINHQGMRQGLAYLDNLGENHVPVQRASKDITSATGPDTDSVAHAPSTRLIATSIWSQQVAHSTGTFRTVPAPMPPTTQQQQPLLLPHHLYYPGLSDVAADDADKSHQERITELGAAPSSLGNEDGGKEFTKTRLEHPMIEDASHNVIMGLEESGPDESQADVSLYREPAIPPIPVPMSMADHPLSGSGNGSLLGRISTSNGTFRPPLGGGPLRPTSLESTSQRNFLAQSDKGAGGHKGERLGMTAEDVFLRREGDNQPPLHGLGSQETKGPDGNNSPRTPPAQQPPSVMAAFDENNMNGQLNAGPTRRFNSLYEMRLEQARQAIHDAQEPVRYAEMAPVGPSGAALPTASLAVNMGTGSVTSNAKVGAFKDVSATVGAGHQPSPVIGARPGPLCMPVLNSEVGGRGDGKGLFGHAVHKRDVGESEQGKGTGVLNNLDLSGRVLALERTTMRLIEGHERVHNDLERLLDAMSMLERVVHSVLENVPQQGSIFFAERGGINDFTRGDEENVKSVRRKDKEEHVYGDTFIKVAEPSGLIDSSRMRSNPPVFQDISNKLPQTALRSTDDVIRSLEDRMLRTSALLQEKSNFAGSRPPTRSLT